MFCLLPMRAEGLCDSEIARRRGRHLHDCGAQAGKRFVQVKDAHNSHEWAKMIAFVAEELYPDAEPSTLVQDNLTAHRKATSMRCLRQNGPETCCGALSLSIHPGMAPGSTSQKSNSVCWAEWP